MFSINKRVTFCRFNRLFNRKSFYINATIDRPHEVFLPQILHPAGTGLDCSKNPGKFWEG
jgi:hypothetical protein